jgi:O-antigen/teichoic acid export membrane protein
VIRSMFLSSGARAIGLPVTAVAAALTTFLIVDERGAAAYGYVMLLGLLFQLIPFADLGMGAAVTTAVAVQDRSEVDRSHAADVVRAAFWMLVCSSVVLVIAALTLTAFDAWGGALQIPGALTSQAPFALVTAFVPFAISLPLGIGQRILLGQGKNHYVNLIAVLGPVAALATTWLLLRADLASMYLAMATPLGVMVVAAICFATALRTSGLEVREILSPRRIRRDIIAQVWRSAGPMLVIMITVPIALQSDRIILAHVGTGQDVASYSVAAQFYTPTFSLISTAAVALWPIFAQETSQALRQWKRAVAALAVVGGIAALCYGVLIQPVADLLTSAKAPVDLSLAVAFAVLILVMALHQPSAMFLTTADGLRFQAICSALMVVVNIPLSLYLAHQMGSAGPVWGSIISTAAFQLIPAAIRAARVARNREIEMAGRA